jgi:hypothetical protein
MLKDLTRADWLHILGLPESRVPAALIVRGTGSGTAVRQPVAQPRAVW